MADVETLGARLRAISRSVPTDETKRAADSLFAARAGLVAALRQSSEPVALAQLASALDSVERAQRQLALGVDCLDQYLVAIGVAPRNSRTSETDTAHAFGERAEESDNRWRQRVIELSDGEAATRPRSVSMPRVFSELVSLARNGSRDSYREKLLAAGAVGGSQLPGLSWPAVKEIHADLAEHAPKAVKPERLARYVREIRDAVLPKLTDDVAIGQLNAACSLPGATRAATRTDTDDAVDHAVAGPIMVAALLRARDHAGRG